MASFLIKRNDKEQKITKIINDKVGYDFKPNIKSIDIEVNKITVYNDTMIDKILSKKIKKTFERLATITYDILSNMDEDSSSDAIIALGEIDRLRGIILNKYQKFLKKETEKEYLKKLRFLENELRSKIIMINTFNKIEEEIEERGHGR